MVVVMIDAHCQRPMLAMLAVVLVVFVVVMVQVSMVDAIGSMTALRASSSVLLLLRRTT